MHEEPWRFVIVQDRRLLHDVADTAKRTAKADAANHGRLLNPPGASGDGIVSVLADPEFNIFYDADAVILICRNWIRRRPMRPGFARSPRWDACCSAHRFSAARSECYCVTVLQTPRVTFLLD
jgi:nitroreductase